MNCGHPLFGGIDLAAATEMHRQAVAVAWARKNLWHVTIQSPIVSGQMPDLFNLYCLSVDYSPITLTGEKRKIGTAFADSLSAAESIELSMTTLDDEQGSIKSWFNSLATLAAPSDGTVNPPAVYATKITVRQAFLDGVQGYPERYLYRPGSLAISLSRSESVLQELTLTFVQLDTFMPA